VASLNPIHTARLLDEVALKISALVRVDTAWHSKLAEPFINKHLSYCRSPLVVGWDCLSVLGKDICQDKDILHPIVRRFKYSKVNSHYLIWTRGQQMTHVSRGSRLCVFKLTGNVHTPNTTARCHGAFQARSIADGPDYLFDPLMSMFIMQLTQDLALKGPREHQLENLSPLRVANLAKEHAILVLYPVPLFGQQQCFFRDLAPFH